VAETEAGRVLPAADDDDWRQTGRIRGRAGFTQAGQGVDPRVYARSRGELRAVLVAVDFQDAQASACPGAEADAATYFDWLVPEGARWLERSSNGRLRLRGTLVPRWFRMSRPQAEYGFTRGISTERHHAYIQEVAALAEGEVDLSAYDLLYVVVPKSADAVTFSPTWVDRGLNVRTGTGHVVRWAVTFGQDMWRWGFKVLDHETGHTLGLPDLYTYHPVGEPPNAHANVGGWDLMGLISGHAPELLAWQKWRLGWIDDAQVRVLGPGERAELDLAPVERPGGVQLAVLPLGPSEAIMVECRRAVGNDEGAQDQGVLVYRVDSAAPRGGGPSVRVVRRGGRDGFGPRDLVDACFRADAAEWATWRTREGGEELEVRVLEHGGEHDVVRLWRR